MSSFRWSQWKKLAVTQHHGGILGQAHSASRPILMGYYRNISMKMRPVITRHLWSSRRTSRRLRKGKAWVLSAPARVHIRSIVPRLNDYGSACLWISMKMHSVICISVIVAIKMIPWPCSVSLPRCCKMSQALWVTTADNQQHTPICHDVFAHFEASLCTKRFHLGAPPPPCSHLYHNTKVT